LRLALHKSQGANIFHVCSRRIKSMFIHTSLYKAVKYFGA
jgi:hypothetical protein